MTEPALALRGAGNPRSNGDAFKERKASTVIRLINIPPGLRGSSIKVFTFHIKTAPELFAETSRVADGFHITVRIGACPLESVNIQVLDSVSARSRGLTSDDDKGDKSHTEMLPSPHPAAITLAVGCQAIAVASLLRRIRHRSKDTPSSR